MLIGRHWEVYGNRDEPALNANKEVIDFLADNNNSASFKFKQQITAQIGRAGTNYFNMLFFELLFLNQF